jgi:hypothetical protein
VCKRSRSSELGHHEILQPQVVILRRDGAGRGTATVKGPVARGLLPDQDQSEWQIEWQNRARVGYSGAGGRSCQLAFCLVIGHELALCEYTAFHGKEKVYGSIP